MYPIRIAPLHRALIFYHPYSHRIEILHVIHGSPDLEELFHKEGID